MKALLIIIAAIFISFGSFAQTAFAPIGAEWSYRKVVPQGMGGSGYEYLTRSFCDSSYLMDGKIIKIVRNEKYRQNYQYNYSAGEFQFYDRDTVYYTDSFYEQNDTVFAYNSLWQQFTPLYVYNVQEGDTITLPAFSMSLASSQLWFSHVTDCVTQFDSTFSFKIDSIRTVNYNGTDLETYFTSPVFTIDWDSIIVDPFGGAYIYKTHQLVANWTYFFDRYTVEDPPQLSSDSTNVYYPTGAYIKNIGGLGAGFFPANEVTHNGQMADVVVHELANLNCYDDNQLHIQFQSYDCNSFRYNTPLAVKNIASEANLNIYPNPAGNILHIDTKQSISEGRIMIVNLLGKTVIATTDLKQQQTVDVSSLTSGIYLLILETGQERYYHKFIKE